MGIPTNQALQLSLKDMASRRLFSYIVARDYGFAPNPFHGICSLATCKPEIRRLAQVGDWVVGTGSKTNRRAGHAVFAMQVTEILSSDEYWIDRRFYLKKPDLHSSRKRAFGDNIYHRDEDGDWMQEDSHHSLNDGRMNDANIEHDTRVPRVLLSTDFVYWGGDGPSLPLFDDQSIVSPARGHRSKFPASVITEFERWIRNLDDEGYCGAPVDWS